MLTYDNTVTELREGESPLSIHVDLSAAQKKRLLQEAEHVPGSPDKIEY